MTGLMGLILLADVTSERVSSLRELVSRYPIGTAWIVFMSTLSAVLAVILAI